MIHGLIAWATNSRAIVLLTALALAVFGLFSFFHVNVEAYPDPAPAIVEIVAQYPGASAEEVERLVTIPLEVTLAGMPGLAYTRTKSLFQLCHIRCQFEYGVDFNGAKQEVLNRLTQAQLPAGVTPSISPETPTGEIYRYTLTNPTDAGGRPIYNHNDLKALQDWSLERVFRRVPRIGDVASFGGTSKRYEIHPDPDLMKRYGITLAQVQNAIAGSNVNVGGDYIRQGNAAQVVRGIGLLGGGEDPVQKALGMKDPAEAARHLREEEVRRLREIRDIAITSVNNVPVRVGDIVDGGRVPPGYDVENRGVIVGHQTRLGQIAHDRPLRDEEGKEVRRNGQRVWDIGDDVVEGVVLLRKDEHSLPALRDIENTVAELNGPHGDKLLPGVKIQPYYDRTELTQLTRETVNENLTTGMALVAIVLLMFLGNVRAAVIVAINIPLALLFAFSVLFLRNKSANLLSIGAVDFGIIVDSSVIMVENIFRVLSTGQYADLPLRQRVVRSAGEVERSLFFSTLIMICALLPLFTMRGPEGQLFGPMAQTYAFALGGALLFAVTLSPVLCQLFMKGVRQSADNFLVRGLKLVAVRFVELCLRFRTAFLVIVGLMFVGTLAALPFLGNEFMPELEEGNFWITLELPFNVSMAETVDKVRIARSIMRKYDEIELITAEMGRDDSGTDPQGFYHVEFFVPLKQHKDWPATKKQTGSAGWFHSTRARTKDELAADLGDELKHDIPGVDWNFSQNIRDNVMEALSGVKGENSVKIFGPDLNELERLAEETKKILQTVDGLTEIGIYHIKGQTNLDIPIDRRKCALWNVAVADAWNALQTAVGGKAFSQMIEGEKTFDITLRWPERLRQTKEQILNIPVEVANTVSAGSVGSVPQTPLTGQSTGLTSLGTSNAMPAVTGGQFNGAINYTSATPRRRLGDLVTPQDEEGRVTPDGSLVHSGASTIFREQGSRVIAVKFNVVGRDLGSAVAQAREKTEHLWKAPYHAEWTGEFQEMQEAELRLIAAVSISLILIFILLYTAFHSLLDTTIVLTSVISASMGGVWAMLLTGTNFNIAAGVGFISIIGVGVMNGLIIVTTMNHLRAEGATLHEAIVRGVERRARPIMMTALTAILGLAPAAVSTRIGCQTQKPLAIAVIGGMLMTILLFNVIPVLYSFYGHREPPAGSGNLAEEHPPIRRRTGPPLSSDT